MRIDFKISNKATFSGKREDRSRVTQLINNNDYALTENNQRNIRDSIKNLSNESDEQNIKFLMGVAQNLKYGVNLDLNKQSNNNWKTLLQNATKQAISKTSDDKKPSLESEFRRVFLDKAELKPEEKEILGLRDEILTSDVIKESSKTVGNENITNIPKNLDYFVISSEVSLKEKKVCLEKMKFFLSPEYEINEQLKNQKAEVLSEMLNDIIVKTPESGCLTIKEVDQQHHGMCAAISISRKALAYEDKSKYVDLLLTELDNKDTMDIYDISKLGQGVKVAVPKVYIDFDYAKQKGYRIIDASVLNWMNNAGRSGATGKVSKTFVAFDKKHFDTFQDGFFTRDLDDKDMASQHDYLRAIIKAKENIGEVKSSLIKSKILAEGQMQQKDTNLAIIKDSNSGLEKNLSELMPEKQSQEIHQILNEMINLSKKKSVDVESKFDFIPNEEECMKKAKIADFIASKDSNIDKELLSSKIDKIYDLYDASNTANLDMTKHHKPETLVEISRANEKMFSAGAAYRTSVDVQLDCPNELERMLVKYNVDDFETRIAKNLDKLSNTVKNPQEEKITGLLMQKLNLNSKTEVLGYLSDSKNSIDEIKTTKFDDIYRRMLQGSRKDVLVPYIDDAENKIKNGDIEQLMTSATTLGVGANKTVVLGKLSEMKESLKGNVSEEKYTETFNKLGFKSQGDLVGDIYDAVMGVLSKSKLDSPAIVAFAKENNVDTTEAGINKAFKQLADDINMSEKTINNVGTSIELEDEDGKLVNTVESKKVLLNVLEQKGVIIPEAKLEQLRTKFIKIGQFEAEQETQMTKGIKIKNPDIYKYTPEENETLGKIENNLNTMYKDTLSEYNRNNKILAKPLGNLFSEVGKETGHFWVGEEGQSGLFTAQEIRIFEQMTDRRYFAQENLEKAAEQIKNSAHSGTSATSVYHKSYGGHAQYMADIKPITLINPKTGSTETKDAMMHDNSWGKAEHNNTWADSSGLLRTDYGSERGGPTGYITDETYKNGTFIQDFLEIPGEIEVEQVNSKAYGKIKKDHESFKFSMFADAILPGKNSKLRDKAVAVSETVFLTAPIFANDFRAIVKKSKDMSDEELKASFKRVEMAGSGAGAIEQRLLDLIEGNKNDEGLSTVEKYNALDKNHPLKIFFKKMAIKDSYSSSDLRTTVDKCTKLDELNKVEETVNSLAKNEFKYVFGKNIESVAFIDEAAGKEIIEAAQSLLKKNGLSTGKKMTTASFKKLLAVPKDKFDGSLSNTINQISDNIVEGISNRVADKDKFALVKDEFKNELSTIMKNKAEFNISDLADTSENLTTAKKWIDKQYNPSTDEEFVEIFKGLQNKTTVEFDGILDKMSPADLGIKKINEYDYVRAIRSANESAGNKLSTEVFVSELTKDMKFSETKPFYTHEKFRKKHIGSTYPKKGKEFDEMYRNLYISCENLNITKFVNKQKDKSFSDYGARPAFPDPHILPEKGIADMVISIGHAAAKDVKQLNAFNRQLNFYEQGDRIKEIMETTPADKPLTEESKDNLVQLLSEIALQHQEDEGLKDAVDASIAAAGLKDTSNISCFTPYLESIMGVVNLYKTAVPKETLEVAIENTKNEIKDSEKMFVKANIQPRYQPSVTESFDNYIKSVKNNKGDSENLLTKLVSEVSEHHITKEPTVFLKEALLMSQKDDPKEKDVQSVYSSYMGALMAAAVSNELSFELIHAAEGGLSHELKTEFKNIKVPQGLKGAGEKLDSEKGSYQLIKQVKNWCYDDSATVHLFLDQLGLNEEALAVEIKDINLKKLKNLSDSTLTALQDGTTANKIVSTEYNKIKDKVANKNNDLPTIMSDLNNEIDKQAKEAGLLDLSVVNIYKAAFTEFADVAGAMPDVDRASLLGQFINEKGIKPSQAYLIKLDDDTNAVFEGLIKKAEYLEKLSFPEGSQADKDRIKLIEDIDKAIEYNNTVE